MLIYWLFEEPEVIKITINNNRRRIKLHKDDSVLNLVVDGFSIEGNGNEVKVVDLDNLVLII